MIVRRWHLQTSRSLKLYYKEQTNGVIRVCIQRESWYQDRNISFAFGILLMEVEEKQFR